VKSLKSASPGADIRSMAVLRLRAARAAFRCGGRGLLAGLGLGALLFQPVAWQPQTSMPVTLICMLTFFLFALMFARDAGVRTKILNESRQLARAQVEEIGKLQEQLREEALRDPLTGLHNRRHLAEALPGALARCARLATPLTLVPLAVQGPSAAGELMLQHASGWRLALPAGIDATWLAGLLRGIA